MAEEQAKPKVEEEKKQDENIPKILIGIPILAWTHEFAESFLKFWTDLMTFPHDSGRFHVGYHFMYRMPVHKAEEQLADIAVNTGCTHLLLMDDDIYDVTAQDMLTLLKADKDVIGGIMHASGFPYAMCAFRRYDTKNTVAEQPILKGPARLYEVPPDQRKGIQKVDLIPFGFTLIKTSVFKGLARPWFSADNQAPTDSWFADRVLNKKLEYFAHFDVWLNHRGITKETYPHWLQIGVIKAKAKGPATVINLTPEEMKRHEVFMRMKLEESEKLLKTNATAKVDFQEKKAGDSMAQPVR